jgi:DnaK suppressor protein
MNDSERQTLIAIIEKKIRRLNIILERGDVIKKQAKEELKHDESARLDSLNYQMVDESLFLAAKHEFNQLKSNLDWLNSSAAGECEECNCEIPIKRLIAVPTTRKCVNCTSKK